MNERAIRFNGPMVRATLDRSKTMTRRIAKAIRHPDTGARYTPERLAQEPQHVIERASPYGEPGDRLWVRESGIYKQLAGMGEKRGLFRHDVPETPEIGRYWVERTRAPGASYNAASCDRDSALLSPGAKAVADIHMPRWACRLVLGVVGVRLERLQDITEAECIAEGLAKTPSGFYSMYGQHEVDGTFSPRASYRALWEMIHGPGSWDANPFVWAVKFKRLETAL